MRVEIYGIPLTAGKRPHKFITIKELPSDSAFSKNRTSKYKRPLLGFFFKNKK